MTIFPTPVLDYWREAFPSTSSPTWAVSETLDPKRPVMMLESIDGSVRKALRPELAARMGGRETQSMPTADVREQLARAGISLHDPDYLYYLPAGTHLAPDQSMAPRLLTSADSVAFDAFQAEASEQDRDDAFVELDHWAAFGCFNGDRLVSAASAVPWESSLIADLGVLTLPDVRGQGYARAVVLAISRFSHQQGYEPQYRCQIDNLASVELAKSCGFALFGKWVVASVGSADTPLTLAAAS